ncbi:MAG: copper homeostasis protein CutC [Flavobacteriales bacterium]|nr:copper homeostasis protein CutC [Flavobacteriales bacterium]MEB2342832.1 copper homeostasis protein CutC [Flavobacteriia bacterium]
MLLELCAYNLASCHLAALAGAGRIELCADPLQGGTTPSIGTVQAALGTGLPVFPIVRPRGGNFRYDAEEVDVMLRDIRAFRELGCPGIVTGALRVDGTIDAGLMARFGDAAGPMRVACHKAFDEVPDAAAALEDLIAAGCCRVLTSGCQATAMDGASTIHALVQRSAGRITIMPGGGVRSTNLRQLIAATGATEFHSSALTARSVHHTADELEVRALVAALAD